MAENFVDAVNRILRDHQGYTGDGGGGHGVLPTGDPTTARKPISKRDLRELMIQIAQTLGDPSALQSIVDGISNLRIAVDQSGFLSASASLDGIDGLVIRADLDDQTGYPMQVDVLRENTLHRYVVDGGDLVDRDARTSQRIDIIRSEAPDITIEPYGHAVYLELDDATGFPLSALVIGGDGDPLRLIAKGDELVPDVGGDAPPLPDYPDYLGGLPPDKQLPKTNWTGEVDVLHFFMIWGQSYAQGTNPDDNDEPVSGLTPYPDSLLMFGIEGHSYGRVRPYSGTSTPLPVDRFVPLKEEKVEATKETLASGIGEVLYDSIKAQIPSADLKFLFATVGSGGARYEGLYRGTRFSSEAIRLMSKAVEFAKADGRRVVVNVIVQHGEADNKATESAAYARMLIQLRRHLEADAKKITGQTEPVLMFVNQCQRGPKNAAGKNYARPQSAPAVLTAAKTDALIIPCSGIYATDKDAWGGVGGGAHPSALGYRRAGEMVGRSVFEEMAHVGAQTLRIEGVQRLDSTSLIIRCSDLVLVDTSGDVVGTDGILENGGIWVQDGSGTPLSITSLENVHDASFGSQSAGTTRTLKATLSRVPTGEALEWLYATNTTGDGIGRLDGPRGLLRKPDAFYATTDAGGDPIPYQSRITTGDRRILSWCAIDTGIVY